MNNFNYTREILLIDLSVYAKLDCLTNNIAIL